MLTGGLTSNRHIGDETRFYNLFHKESLLPHQGPIKISVGGRQTTIFPQLQGGSTASRRLFDIPIKQSYPGVLIVNCYGLFFSGFWSSFLLVTSFWLHGWRSAHIVQHRICREQCTVCRFSHFTEEIMPFTSQAEVAATWCSEISQVRNLSIHEFTVPILKTQKIKSTASDVCVLHLQEVGSGRDQDLKTCCSSLIRCAQVSRSSMSS